MVTKILVPVDGSEVSQKAAQYAVGLAKQTGATLIFMSVIDKRSLAELRILATKSPTFLVEPVEEYLNRSALSATKEAEKLCEHENLQYTAKIRLGHPVEEIVNEAADSKVDLIVMGSHGASALKAAVLGSVAYGVMHKESDIPVLIVRR